MLTRTPMKRDCTSEGEAQAVNFQTMPPGMHNNGETSASLKFNYITIFTTPKKPTALDHPKLGNKNVSGLLPHRQPAAACAL